MIDVVIPVGPYPDDKKYLPECLTSIAQQTVLPANVILIDDMANLEYGMTNPYIHEIPHSIIRNPWRLGCADCWNIGVALARNELCLLMGADDWLEPRCIEVCLKTWREKQDSLGYYYMSILYSTGEAQSQPCNAAMVTKTLWRHTGGFSPESGLGAPDALLISILLGNQGKAGNLHQVGKGEILYNVRVHEGQDTRRTGKYHQQIIDVRNIATATWEPAKWSR